ncbi:putative phosphatase regulatory subunit-domain-containing protein [Fimicolochytrium jonesii]|uniref:putative phosphatase regulatory subunit-domain-containing protein n=1 Tax=Fimicolochytrium jonesii TaxID=1396493 RepID=UPI0022FEEA2D|nr:putative phosphatase regulatory subunit-domain-containing protein [Fimicolochytrium jonesii]KAI8817819.1 putative phosphatase regulatory subunit-domain-containing protein [Fimicolochytrium jonesii]
MELPPSPIPIRHPLGAAASQELQGPAVIAPAKVDKTLALRSCLRSRIPAPRSAKKKLRFSQTLESGCRFVRGCLVTAIPQAATYTIRDTGDLTWPTAGAALRALQTWRIEESTLPANLRFENRAVAVDRVWVERDEDSTLSGEVLVRNYAFQKCVTIHYSIDNWRTSADVDATFATAVSFSTPGFVGVDRFRFMLDLGREFGPKTLDATVAFAVRYEVAGSTEWDNNYGRNYTIKLRRGPEVGLCSSPVPSPVPSPPLSRKVMPPAAQPRPFDWVDQAVPPVTLKRGAVESSQTPRLGFTAFRSLSSDPILAPASEQERPPKVLLPLYTPVIESWADDWDEWLGQPGLCPSRATELPPAPSAITTTIAAPSSSWTPAASAFTFGAFVEIPTTSAISGAGFAFGLSSLGIRNEF